MGERITIDVGGERVEAYLTGRASEGSELPGVLLCMDAIGLRPRLEEMADEIASWGHTVLVPHLFHRHGSVADLAPTRDLREDGAREEFFGRVMPFVSGYTAEQMVADATAGVAALREHGVRGPLGAVGYCMGARVAVRAAGAMPDDVAVCAGFHAGGLVTGEEGSPHQALATARASFAFGHADQDPSMPPEAVATLGLTLSELGLSHVNEIYPGAPHGFTMADTAMYDAQATERHWFVLRDLLRDLLTPLDA